MILLKKALLYDISNMAYMIADTGEPLNHSLHKVRDICQDSNIDRVARVLGLAYSNIIEALRPIINSSGINPDKDLSSRPRNYSIPLRCDHELRHILTPGQKLRIKEHCHVYMVSLALQDWLEMTLPQAADVWKDRAEGALEALQAIASSIISSLTGGLRRRVSPF